MTSGLKESKKRLDAKLRKIENDLIIAQEKLHCLARQIQDTKDFYATAMNNIDEAEKRRDYAVSRLRKEYEWKTELMSWNDSNRKDIKWLSEQVCLLKDKVIGQSSSSAPREYCGMIAKIKKVVRYGFGLALGLAMGLAMTTMPQ